MLKQEKKTEINKSKKTKQKTFFNLLQVSFNKKNQVEFTTLFFSNKNISEKTTENIQ